jgi:glycosyltransferase involved in cell wall biosynthesis
MAHKHFCRTKPPLKESCEISHGRLAAASVPNPKGSEKMTYAAILPTRNGASTIKQTLGSILHQSLRAAQICVVDDGSTDETSNILKAFVEQDAIKVVTRPDQGYDIRRVPFNLNLAYSNLNGPFDYLMISGDDCIYPTDYADSIITFMESDPRIGVASGRPRTMGNLLSEHLPSGSGRIVRHSLWRTVGESYPQKVGWEAWLLFKALQNGFSTPLYADFVYEHLRPRGSTHQFAYWGSAMHSLGYHPLYALGRMAKNLVRKEIPLAGSVSILRGYLAAVLGSSDPFVSNLEQSLRDFVHDWQKRRMARIMMALTDRLSRH